MLTNTPLEKAIKAAGGQAALARAIGVSQQSVFFWLKKGRRRVPAEHVEAISRATGVPAHELRPDVFAAPSEGQAA